MLNTYKSSKETHDVALVLSVRLHGITDVDLRLGGDERSHHQWPSRNKGAVTTEHSKSGLYVGWREV